MPNCASHTNLPKLIREKWFNTHPIHSMYLISFNIKDDFIPSCCNLELITLQDAINFLRVSKLKLRLT